MRLVNFVASRSILTQSGLIEMPSLDNDHLDHTLSPSRPANVHVVTTCWLHKGTGALAEQRSLF